MRRAGLREQVSGDVVQGRIIPARAGFTRSWAVTMGVPRDHPRSRGVYPSSSTNARNSFGSSPLARGLHLPRRHRRRRGRIIPARAGFTHRRLGGASARPDHPRSRGVYLLSTPPPGGRHGSSPLARGLLAPCSASRSRQWDHPRSRGVYRPAISSCATSSGSSPLARGLRACRGTRKRRGRIIPARAGFTLELDEKRECVRDHPRSRGVYGVLRFRPAAARGSSPLARGLRARSPDVRRTHRIIPARAGFTPPGSWGRPSGGDHPRSRGVYAHARTRPADRAGSSPLARGLPDADYAATLKAGIIPARAGFTWDAPNRGNREGDHPRSRGVYAYLRRAERRGDGSSPLARGLPTTLSTLSPMSRIIPARAGFTSPTPCPGLAPRDHPRSRGVYAVGQPDYWSRSGSSPLARGLRVASGVPGNAIRIIPARAGFTGFPTHSCTV